MSYEKYLNQHNLYLFKISYFYHDQGMAKEDKRPELIIIAPDKDRAAYLYLITTAGCLNEFKAGSLYNNFDDFTKSDDVEKYWGLTIHKYINDEWVKQ